MFYGTGVHWSFLRLLEMSEIKKVGAEACKQRNELWEHQRSKHWGDHRRIEEARSVKASIDASAETSAVEASAVKASTVEARCGSTDARHWSVEEASTKVRSIKERPLFRQSNVWD
jgi:hypothetical protein